MLLSLHGWSWLARDKRWPWSRAPLPQTFIYIDHWKSSIQNRTSFTDKDPGLPQPRTATPNGQSPSHLTSLWGPGLQHRAPSLAHSHEPRVGLKGEEGWALQRGSALQTLQWLMGPRVTWGLYSRLPPVGRSEGQGRASWGQALLPPAWWQCGPTQDYHPQGPPGGYMASGLSGREDSRLHMCWGLGWGRASVTPVQSPRSPQQRTAASPSAVHSSCMAAGPAGWNCQERRVGQSARGTGQSSNSHRGIERSHTVTQPRCQLTTHNRVLKGPTVPLDHKGIRGGDRATGEMGNCRRRLGTELFADWNRSVSIQQVPYIWTSSVPTACL